MGLSSLGNLRHFLVISEVDLPVFSINVTETTATGYALKSGLP